MFLHLCDYIPNSTPLSASLILADYSKPMETSMEKVAFFYLVSF